MTRKRVLLPQSQAVATGVGLADVIITSDLQNRPSRDIDLQKENSAFRELADHLATDPEKFLERLVDLARTLCDAGTVGISVEQTNAKGERIFLWVAMAGELKNMLGGTTPRNFSPCGICVDQKTPLLMDRLDRFYPYFREAPLPFIEALLIPWEIKDGANGTLWAVTHSDKRKFDREDVRLLGCLAAFACGAIRLQQTLAAAEHVSAMAKVLNQLAHDINNPLQGAMLALSCVNSGEELSPETRAMALIAENELKRVAALSAELIRKPV
jgi:hypothetical protein